MVVDLILNTNIHLLETKPFSYHLSVLPKDCSQFWLLLTPWDIPLGYQCIYLGQALSGPDETLAFGLVALTLKLPVFEVVANTSPTIGGLGRLLIAQR